MHPVFHSATMTPEGLTLAWAWPDGTVRLARLVYREGGRYGTTIRPGGYGAVPRVTADPSTLWPETVPPSVAPSGPVWVSADKWQCRGRFIGCSQPHDREHVGCLSCGAKQPSTRED